MQGDNSSVKSSFQNKRTKLSTTLKKMEGYVRIIEALDFCLDNIDDKLNYKIENSAISKCVKVYNGIEGDCKCWLKIITEFSKVKHFSTANSIN